MPPSSADLAANRIGAAASGFGVSAVVTILFSTILTIVLDVFPTPTAWLTKLTGHPWTGHGLIDVILFFVLGFVLTRTGRQRDGIRLAIGLAIAAMIGGGGLTLWFLLA